ncbi:MAG: class I SAM-dependent methyltransferase [Alkalilacustris sp.]
MGFSSDWLALREPADGAARDGGLLDAAAAEALRAAGGAAPVLVDLGCGTGSTVRAFGGRLPGAAWRLVDADAGLLAEAVARCGGTAHRVDLARLGELPLEGAHLVTASALLDLMPADWVAGLADLLAASGIGLYAALSYDGVMRWTPALPGDAGVTAAFNAHQRTDKGIGPALGPDAARRMADALRARRFAVRLAASPWRLGPEQAALHAELCAGIAAAAAEAGCLDAPAWLAGRGAFTTAEIGHLDLLALPPGAG